MTQAIPEVNRQWKVIGENGLDSLQISDGKSPEVGDSQVLVKSWSNMLSLIAPTYVV